MLMNILVLPSSRVHDGTNTNNTITTLGLLLRKLIFKIDANVWVCMYIVDMYNSIEVQSILCSINVILEILIRTLI